MTFTRAEKRAEALREVGQRKRVYRRLVADGRMTQADCDRQTDEAEQPLGGHDRVDRPREVRALPPDDGAADEAEPDDQESSRNPGHERPIIRASTTHRRVGGR